MKLLVIGKNGFIAKNLTEYFKLKKEYDVTNIGSADLDLLDEVAVKNYLTSNCFDIIINPTVHNPRTNGMPDKELEFDLRMFHNIAKCRKLYGKMICFGSGAEYDKRYPICSVSEDDLISDKGKNCSGLVPVNPYGVAKYTIGREIDGDVYGEGNIYSLRIFGLFGKYEYWKTTFISGACCKALKNLPITIRRDVFFDYLYIDDFLVMLERFINIDKPKYKTYNFTSGRRVKLTDLAEIVRKVSEKDVPIYICNEGLANEYTASNERLMKEIGGFQFESYEDSIRKLYKYYESIENQIDLESLLYQ